MALQFNVMVTHTYQAEDTAAQDGETEEKSLKTPTSRQAELKTFSFYTVIDLGVIIPREKEESHRRDSEQMSVS